jgi:hypothetical protein
MTANPEQSKGRDGALSTLNMAIEGVDLAGDILSITPARGVFGSASALLAMIRVRSFLVFCGDELPLHARPGLYA